jgi:predicted ATPase
VTLRTATLDPAAPDDEYPFGLPVVRALPVDFDPKVTIFVGENGSGKSTLVEAIAVAAGFNAEGGSRNAVFATERTDSPLGNHLRLTWRAARRLDLGYFLRAESFCNVASDRDRVLDGGEPSLHRLSHGESFLEVARQWFGQRRLVLLDEPESALSFTG